MKKKMGFRTALVLLALCAAAWAEGTWEEAVRILDNME